mgnify:CR=1 FL=1
MKHRVKGSLVLLVLLIITALGILFYQSLSWHYEMQGAVTDLSGIPMTSSGYEVVSAGGGPGKRFKVTGEDPQFLLEIQKNGMVLVGGIQLIFGEVRQAQEPLAVQVFYAAQGEEFSEKHSVKGALKAGEKAVLLPVPPGQYETLRFDIDGDFELTAIQSCAEPMAAQAYVSQDTVQRCLWYFPAVIIGFSLIYWAHGVRFKQGGFTARAYLKSVFLGAETTEKREVYLDYLRVLAAVLVILAHTCSPMVDAADADWKRLVLVLGLSLGLCCNILYVMLSGTLLLGGSQHEREGVLSFYIRRASKVIIPLIAYYFLLLHLNDEVRFLPPKQIGAALKRIMTGAPDVGPHLWLIYTIVALYLVTPFFRVMVQHMSDRLLSSLAVVILVLNALTTYLPVFGMAFGASTFLAGWEGVFLLGYILTRQSSQEGAPRRIRWILCAAAVSYVVMAAAVFVDSAQMNLVYGSTPPIVLASCGIFVLFIKYKDWFQDKSNAVVRLCSKYSYSIILIHWYALFVVVQGKLHITALRFGCLGGIAASVAATFAVCLVMAFVFDNTIVIVCNVLFDRLTSRFVKRG